MRFGPLSNSDIEILKELLDEHEAQYSITHSVEDFEGAKEKRLERDREIVRHPTYRGPDQFLYIEIEIKDLLIVRGTLENMGIIVRSTPAEMLPELPEYFCPRCKFSADHQGNCPKHNLVLLDFSNWVAARKAIQEKRGAIWKKIIVIGLILFAGFYIYTTITSSHIGSFPFKH